MSPDARPPRTRADVAAEVTRIENERALAASDVPAAVRTAAEELRGHLAERAAYVRVELAGAATGGSISVDGYVLTQTGLEVPVSPAQHTLVVSLHGEEVARRQLEIATGEHRIVTLGEAVATTDPEQSVSSGRSIDQEDWFWPVVDQVANNGRCGLDT